MKGNVSRRSFIGGAVAGAAAAWGLSALNRSCVRDDARPPWVSEFFVDSFWLHEAGFYESRPNPPLKKGKVTVDVAVIGGGSTGVACAYHLARRFPDRRIVLLEAAGCGYGASGRNGGMVLPFHPFIGQVYRKDGPEAAHDFYRVNRQGLGLVNSIADEHGIDCEIENSGVLVAAMEEADMESLSESHGIAKDLGIESRLLDRDEIVREIKSGRYHGGWRIQEGAIINPAKFVIGMKNVVESMGVEVYERTKVVRIEPGARVRIETEFGEVVAGAVVIATNGYSHRLGLFKSGFIPLCNYILATEPLDADRLESIGWKGREAMWDTRVEFDYIRLSKDNRIVIGGELAPYFYGGGFSTGNYKPSLKMLEESLTMTWPQLEGIKITHRWGGTMAFTMDFLPLIGVTGDPKNVFYGVGYSGEGMGWSQLAGKIISELYAGEKTERTEFMLVNRRPVYIPPEPGRFYGLKLFKRVLASFY